jgi:hypothetical protein
VDLIVALQLNLLAAQLGESSNRRPWRRLSMPCCHHT